MKLHRFYVGELELDNKTWINDPRLLQQWTRVLRFKPGQQLILFNNKQEEKLYEAIEVTDSGVHLKALTTMEPKKPTQDVNLCFSLLKKDKNEWVLQKATELGVRHFVPLITNRTEKTGFDMERAQKIVIEAAEQCGRADIPRVREPMRLETAIEELEGKVALFVAEQGSAVRAEDSEGRAQERSLAIFVGPEGGWTDEEKKLFEDKAIAGLSLGEFTLRAETAAIVAVSSVYNLNK